MTHGLLSQRHLNKLLPIYFANLFFSFHYNILVYVNSSFLEKFFSASFVSLLYILGSAGNILLFLIAVKMEGRFGNRKFFFMFLCLELIAVAGLATLSTELAVALLFIVFQSTSIMLIYSLDIFLEDATYTSETGSVRGIYLTLGNLALVMSPLLIALFSPSGEFKSLYILSGIFLVPLFILASFSFKKFKDGEQRLSGLPFKTWWQSKNIRSVGFVRLTLDIFYSFMVIYMPIYLHQNIGFDWTEIGVIFTIMLLPFVLFEIPVGKLADKWGKEKEFITIGLFIVGITLLFMPFLKIAVVWVWALLLFISRIGASITEVSVESYFFKQVNKNDVGLITIHRLSWPSAFVLGPTLGAISLSIFPFSAMFLLLSLVVLRGMSTSTRL
ncbi:MAG: hypothetical protein AB200_03200 [Parcubacteria bacterium C7867-005]|nr:MAG: hypothetical protein AB200_03200 [Parcubacteria bacterium C7867-005]